MFTKEAVKDFWAEVDKQSAKKHSSLDYMLKNGMIKSKDGKLEEESERSGRSLYACLIGSCVKNMWDNNSKME